MAVPEAAVATPETLLLCTVIAAVAKLEDSTPVVMVLLALTSADADAEVALTVSDALEAVLPVDCRWLVECAELDATIVDVVVGEACTTGTTTI